MLLRQLLNCPPNMSFEDVRNTSITSLHLQAPGRPPVFNTGKPYPLPVLAENAQPVFFQVLASSTLLSCRQDRMCEWSSTARCHTWKPAKTLLNGEKVVGLSYQQMQRAGCKLELELGDGDDEDGDGEGTSLAARCSVAAAPSASGKGQKN